MQLIQNEMKREIVCCNPGMLSVIHIQVETPTMALNIPQT